MGVKTYSRESMCVCVYVCVLPLDQAEHSQGSSHVASPLTRRKWVRVCDALKRTFRLAARPLMDEWVKPRLLTAAQRPPPPRDRCSSFTKN